MGTRTNGSDRRNDQPDAVVNGFADATWSRRTRFGYRPEWLAKGRPHFDDPLPAPRKWRPVVCEEALMARAAIPSARHGLADT